MLDKDSTTKRPRAQDPVRNVSSMEHLHSGRESANEDRAPFSSRSRSDEEGTTEKHCTARCVSGGMGGRGKLSHSINCLQVSWFNGKTPPGNSCLRAALQSVSLHVTLAYCGMR